MLTLLTLLVVAGRRRGRRGALSAAPGAGRADAQVSPLTVAARHDLYGDAFNEAVFMRPGQLPHPRSLVFFDNCGVDGAVNGLAAGIGGCRAGCAALQTGFVRSYALSMLGGAVLVVARPAAGEGGLMHDITGSLADHPARHPASPALLVVALLPRRPATAGQAAHAGARSSTLVIADRARASVSYRRRRAGSSSPSRYDWIKAFGVHYAVGVDGIALVLIALTAVLVPVVVLASLARRASEAASAASAGGFFALMLVLRGDRVGVFAATDVFLFYVFFEAMLIPMYFLIGGLRRRRGAPYAAVKFLLYSPRSAAC